MESSSIPRFPDYGETGDRAGARRNRHAFRLCVLSILLITGMLWVAERFLRYDHAESLYLSALTLPRESARVMLLQAIRTAREKGGAPPAKYVQALAVREEDDVMIAVLEEAYTLDETDSLFALRYGCRLFRTDAQKAAEVFRGASKHPPQNALAAYLEAAAVARAGLAENAIESAMVIVARTNNGDDSNIYPRPIWFAASALPQSGFRYAELSRGIVREITAPLYVFGQQIASEARRQVEEERMQNTRIWLEQLQTMGRRLTQDSEPTGIGQVNAGIFLQLRAVKGLLALSEALEEQQSVTLIESSVRLEDAKNLLAGFEEGRALAIENERREFQRPLMLYQRGLAVVFAVFLAMALAYRILGLRKSIWSMPHSTAAKVTWIAGFLILLGLSHLHTLFQQVPGAQMDFINGASIAWWCTLSAVLIVGAFYPAFTLKSVEEVSRAAGRPEEMVDIIPRARLAYRRVYATLVMRYYGVWTGLYLCLCCAWIISYRVLTGLYPWQLCVLTTGLMNEEKEIALQAIALLG